MASGLEFDPHKLTQFEMLRAVSPLFKISVKALASRNISYLPCTARDYRRRFRHSKIWYHLLKQRAKTTHTIDDLIRLCDAIRPRDPPVPPLIIRSSGSSTNIHDFRLRKHEQICTS